VVSEELAPGAKAAFAVFAVEFNVEFIIAITNSEFIGSVAFFAVIRFAKFFVDVVEAFFAKI
jgi:hypothetical protein